MRNMRSEIHKGFVLAQEFVSHNYEWRCVRIGESFFAHKKIVSGEKASGTLQKGYDNPPISLLNFIKRITDENNLLSVSIDLFEQEIRKFLVNEIQCFFGQSDPYQMKVNNRPGRYLFKDNGWVFEAGDFNKNESYNLRLSHALEQFNQRKYCLLPEKAKLRDLKL